MTFYYNVCLFLLLQSHRTLTLAQSLAEPPVIQALPQYHQGTQQHPGIHLNPGNLQHLGKQLTDRCLPGRSRIYHSMWMLILMIGKSYLYNYIRLDYYFSTSHLKKNKNGVGGCWNDVGV